jgi:surface antigen
MRRILAPAALSALAACASPQATLVPMPADFLYVMMGQADRDLSLATAHAAVGGDGAPRTWNGPNGNWGTVTPERDFTIVGGQRCREYLEDLVVQGRYGASRNTACQDANGGWRTVVTANVR